MSEIALKPVFFMTSFILLVNNLPTGGLKAEFVYEGNKNL